MAGDRRTASLLADVLHPIVAGESLVCAHIAAYFLGWPPAGMARGGSAACCAARPPSAPPSTPTAWWLGCRPAGSGAVRLLVALGWVAAGFLFDLRVTAE